MECRRSPLVVGKPVCVDTPGFLRDVQEICDSGNFTNNGPFNLKLEKQICDYLSVKFAVSVSNATKGIELVLRALKLGEGGEVIIPSYTFVATAHAVVEAGLTPVFCDVSAETHLLLPEYIENLISDRTVAVIAVNLWGLACPKSILELAQRKKIHLIFDSAHAFGAVDEQGDLLGGSGTASVFSMHATKLFNSFEGGIVTTNNETLARRLASMRNFGITGQDEIGLWGTNAKLSEIHAAFAYRQLQVIEETKAIFADHALKYKLELDKYHLTGVKYWNKKFLNTGCTHAYICVQIEEQAPLTRDELMSELRKVDIYAKRYFFPGLHKLEYYSKRYTPSQPLVNTEILNRQVLVLPTGRGVTNGDIERVVWEIARIFHECSFKRSVTEGDIVVDSTRLHLRKKFVASKILALQGEIREFQAELELLDHNL